MTFHLGSIQIKPVNLLRNIFKVAICTCKQLDKSSRKSKDRGKLKEVFVINSLMVNFQIGTFSSKAKKMQAKVAKKLSKKSQDLSK